MLAQNAIIFRLLLKMTVGKGHSGNTYFWRANAQNIYKVGAWVPGRIYESVGVDLGRAWAGPGLGRAMGQAWAGSGPGRASVGIMDHFPVE